ncbi:MAG: protein kinase domain-containing protein, partial [Gemmatimonadaceae bacterium]
LGSGGMATVYLTHDIKHDRHVAIKVLHPDLGAALGGERFLTEIRTTARLQHPHILPLLDSGEADSLLFYVMPLVTGETLRARLEREQQLPVTDAVQIAREVADALGHAHALGVIHRDIKPENILLQGGHALVADFGIALAVQSAGGQRMTQTGLSLGTPQYMSPEQAMGERAIDARSDIYALGAVTYEMLAGEAPFTGPSAQAIVARLLSESPRSLSAQRKSVPEEVEAAVLQALEKLPADRFASAMEFAAALTGGTSARSGTAGPRGAGRGTAAVSWPLVAALAVSVLLAAWGWMRALNGTEPASAVAFTIDQTGPLGIVDPGGFSVIPVALSPDGNTLAFVVQPNGVPMVATRRLDQPMPTVLAGTEGVGGGLVFSPDGRSLAFVQGRKLRRIAFDGTAPVDIAPVNRESSLFSTAWLPGDTIYYSVDGLRQFYRVDAGGVSEPVAIPFPDSSRVFIGLRPVPSTQWLLFGGLAGGDNVYAVSSATGESRILDN